MWYKTIKQQPPEIHSSSIISLQVPMVVSEELAKLSKKLKNQESIENYHITVIYLGKCADLKNKRDDIIDCLRDYASKTNPIIGKISGLGMFPASESSDNKIPLYAGYDGEGLIELRNNLLKKLEKIGVKNASSFDTYTPHITLSYLNNEKEAGKVKVPIIDCNFYKLSLLFGNETHDFVFKV